MRYLPKITDDYAALGDDPAAVAALSSGLDDLVDAYGDDWSLDVEEMELPEFAAH